MSARKVANRAVAPDSPFAPVIGAGRRAAWRRTIIRRVLAMALVLAAGLVVLQRLAPATTDTGSPAPAAPTAAEPPAGGGLFGGLGGPSDPGVNDRQVRSDGQRPGSQLLPAGRLGVVVPVERDVVVRLRVGDSVDLFAIGSGTRVARGAKVLDLTRPGAPGNPADTERGWDAPVQETSSVFLSVSPTDAARMPAAQGSGSGLGPFLVALTPRPPDEPTAAARTSGSPR